MFDQHMPDTMWLQQNKRGMRAVAAAAEQATTAGTLQLPEARSPVSMSCSAPALAPWRGSFLDGCQNLTPDPGHGRQLEGREAAWWWCGTAYLPSTVV